MAEVKQIGNAAKADPSMFPPTLKWEDGKWLTMIVCQSETKPTQHGPGLCLHVVTPESGDETRTVWWPKGAGSPPPLHQPFAIMRVEKGSYKLYIPETDGETLALWESGEPPVVTESKDKLKKAPPKVAEILARFKK